VLSYSNFQKFYVTQLLLILLLGGYQFVFGSWQVQTNILSILPNTQISKALLSSEQALFGQAKKKVTIALTGEKAVIAYNALVTKLNQIESVDIHTEQLPSISQISQFYRPFKDNFLTPQYVKALDDASEMQSLILSQVIQMANPFVSETIAFSPRLALAEYLNTEFNNLTSYKQKQGLITSVLNDKTYYLLSLTISTDTFSIKESQLVAQQLQSVFLSIESEFNVELIYSGVLFHTAQSSKQAEDEISTFGLISLLGIILLILVVFRSITPLFIALWVISLAIIYGGIGLMLFFDDIHLLSFVFAVTLIGIVIDYCFHTFVHANTNHSPKNLIMPLLLGFITTALGYLVIASSPMALLTQVAVFMVFGLLGALLTVLAVLPKLKHNKHLKIQPSVTQVSERIKTANLYLIKFRTGILLVLSLLAIGFIAIHKVSFNDDIRLLNSSPTWLMENENTMSHLSNMQSINRIIVYAPTIEALLQKQEYAITQLKSEQAQLDIKGLFGLLPSHYKQKLHYELLNQAEQNKVFDLGLAQLGLSDPLIEFNALTYKAFKASPLSDIADIYIVQHELGYALWFSVNGELKQNNIKWLSEQQDILLYDTAKNVSNALSQYRAELINLLLIAFFAITLVLIARYGIKQGLLSTLAIGLSAISAVIFTNLISEHLNIFNLLGILLILALAIDYVIFYQEQGIKGPTLLAITLSALSSILAFGMLAFSQTPAVQSFGLTVMFGITFTFLIAPLSANLPRPNQKMKQGNLNDT